MATGCGLLIIASNTGHICVPVVEAEYPDLDILHIADCSAYKVPVELSLVGGDAPLGPVQGIDLFLGRSSVGVSGGAGASHGHSPSGRGWHDPLKLDRFDCEYFLFLIDKTTHEAQGKQPASPLKTIDAVTMEKDP